MTPYDDERPSTKCVALSVFTDGPCSNDAIEDTDPPACSYHRPSDQRGEPTYHILDRGLKKRGRSMNSITEQERARRQRKRDLEKFHTLTIDVHYAGKWHLVAPEDDEECERLIECALLLTETYEHISKLLGDRSPTAAGLPDAADLVSG